MPVQLLAQLLESGVMKPAAVQRFRALMRREGTDLSAMLAADTQAPMRWFKEALPALQADEAARLGFFAGEQARLTSYHLLSVALVSAGSVGEALRLLRFLPLISNILSARFFERKDSMQIILSVHSGDAVLDRLPIFYCATALMRLIRMLSSDSTEMTIRIAWPEPAFLRGHPECMSGRLRFNAPLNTVTVPKATLQRVCHFSDPIAHRNAIDHLQTLMLGAQPADDIRSRVIATLDHQRGLTGITSVAQKLNLSVSTLKRRLAACDTHFTAILEDTLRDRAMLMLADPAMTLDDIASELGYSDLANFSHAFKRWTGAAPGTFRRSYRATASQ